MSLTTPWALLLLLLLPAIWLIARHGAMQPRWRHWASIGARVAIVTLATLALAGAQRVRAVDELAVVFLIDASDSVTAAQRERAETYVRDAIASMGPADQAAVIVFGADSLVERPMSPVPALAPVTSQPQPLHTDMAEAIRLGLALYPAGAARRMVILSDDRPTLDGAVEAAEVAAAAGVEISYVPLSSTAAAAEALIASVSAPDRVSVGESFTLEVTAESTVTQNALLRVIAASEIVFEDSVDLRPGANTFSIRLLATEEAFTRYAVTLSPLQDTYFQNNQLAAFTEITGAPRVLIVAPDGTVDDNGQPLPDEAPQLRQALVDVGLVVDTVTPERLSADLPTLSGYASIVLVNVNAKSLTPRKMTALQQYVRDLGGGLVAIGGPQSYGVGGYFRTPLEETLPVEMQIQDSERFPSVSMVLVIDRSGSMSVLENGVTKIQLAAEGAVRAAELLSPTDDITVIPVDTGPSVVIGPQPPGDPELIRAIRGLSAGGGGIYMRSGLQAAANVLGTSPNQVKHIIVLADGADAEEQNGVPELIAALRAADVTVSMVAIGDGPDVPWLQQMAVLGEGRFHFTDAAANLPQIFTQETTNIQRSYLIEGRFFPTLVNDSPIVGNIDAVPALLGYVGATPKDTAQVVLETDQGDPLLATWQYGLGRAVAWTSDATSRWATEWVRWDGFPVFWAQAVRWTITQSRDTALELDVTLDDEAATLTVDAQEQDGALINDLEMTVNLVAPDGGNQTIDLRHTASGRYVGTFAATREGAYLIRVTGENEGDVTLAQTTGWVLGYSPEYRPGAAEDAVLAEIAALSGGRDLSDAPADAFAHTLAQGRAVRPIFHPLLLVAVLLLPVDIALRRLVVTRRDRERFIAWAFGRFRPTTPAPARSEQMNTLFEAKERAQRRTQRSDAPSAEQPAAATPDAGDAGAPAAAGDTTDDTADSEALAGRLLARRRRNRGEDR